MDLVLPTVPKPLGNYKPVKQAGNLLFVSGTLPLDGHGKLITGRLGEDLKIPEGQKAARLAALNSLAALKNHLGNLNAIKQIVRAVGHILSTKDFQEHAQVMNGASDLFGKVFGENGKHARLALGAYSLPKNAAVELELIVSI